MFLGCLATPVRSVIYLLCAFLQQNEMDWDSMQHPAKRLCRDTSDLPQEEGISAEELSLYYSSPSVSDSPKVIVMGSVML